MDRLGVIVPDGDPIVVEGRTALLSEEGGISAGGPGATVSILEIVVDHLADVLEHAGGDLDAVSRKVFHDGLGNAGGSAPRRSNRALADMMAAVGRGADLASRVSESLLALSRAAAYLAAKARPELDADLKARLSTVGSDAQSLREFQDHLSEKTSFLLDALLGLSNVEQNNVFRVLTIVSVVGIPPTFFASTYGMNFKNMPVRLASRLRLRPDADRLQRDHPRDLVQGEGLVVGARRHELGSLPVSASYLGLSVSSQSPVGQITP